MHHKCLELCFGSSNRVFTFSWFLKPLLWAPYDVDGIFYHPSIFRVVPKIPPFLGDFPYILGCHCGRLSRHRVVQVLCHLLAARADADISEQNGATALHIAAQSLGGFTKETTVGTYTTVPFMVWDVYIHVDVLSFCYLGGGGGNSNIFYFDPENWGRWIQFWRAYFSNGVETTN